MKSIRRHAEGVIYARGNDSEETASIQCGSWNGNRLLTKGVGIMLTRTLIVCMFLAFAWTVSASAYNQELAFPEYPEATFIGESIIDASTAVAIASIKAQELWGEARAGEPIFCTDIDGIINCYMIPFRIGAEYCPAKDDLFLARMQALHRSHAIVEEYRHKIDQADAESLTVDIESKEAFSEAEEIAGPMTARVAKAERAAVLRDSMYQAISALETDTKYGTVLISARKNMYPIQAVFHYVPPFYMSGYHAKHIAQNMLKTSECRLGNLIMLHPGEMYYRFEANDRYAYINCKTLRSIAHPKEFERRVHEHAIELQESESSGCSAQDAGKVADEWDRLLKVIREQ